MGFPMMWNSFRVHGVMHYMPRDPQHVSRLLCCVGGDLCECSGLPAGTDTATSSTGTPCCMRSCGACDGAGTNVALLTKIDSGILLAQPCSEHSPLSLQVGVTHCSFFKFTNVVGVRIT